MKSINLSLTFLIVLIFSSCVKKDLSTATQKTTDVVTNLISTAEFSVPVEAGFTTNVMYKGSLVASTSKPMTILLPKQALGSKSNGNLEVYYQPGTSSASKSSLWQTVVFEDSRESDQDYNDLVIHANYLTTDGNFSVNVQPIALGSSKDIKLGFKWMQGGSSGEVIVAENCRADLFAGKTGYINSFHYEKHYNSFVKEINIPIGDISQAVNVWWFIVVDNGYVINAVNPNGARCLDDKGFPYAFAITDGGAGGFAKSKAKINYSDVDWNKTIVPADFASWAKMPSVPSVPSNAASMDDYQAWKGNNVNHLESGKTYSGDLQFLKDFELYVEGTLDLNHFWGNGPATIYVMPGGKLNIPSGTTVSNVDIISFGEVAMGESVVFQNSTVKVSGSLNIPQTNITLGTKSYLYVKEYLTVNELVCNNTAYFYVGNIEAKIRVYATNKSAGFVEGSLETRTLKLDSNTDLYVGCKLIAKSMDLTNNTTLSVKGHISADDIHTSSSVAINVMNGALVECVTFAISNVGAFELNVIGSQDAVLKAGTFVFSGGLNLTKTFNGNMFIEYEKLKEANVDIDLSNPRIKLPNATVKFNSKDAYLAATGCSPGYNSGNSSEIMSWFAYPIEGVNINQCYDFASWMNGVFDYTIKPGARVFDINNTNPKEGEKLSVYQMKK